MGHETEKQETNVEMLNNLSFSHYLLAHDSSQNDIFCQKSSQTTQLIAQTTFETRGSSLLAF